MTAMKRMHQYIIITFFIVAGLGCKKDGFLPLTDNRPSVDLNVANATDYRPGPTVTASRATNTFSIILEVPSASGRTIKEVTKVAVTNGSSAALFGTVGLYLPGPIAGSGNRATLNTSLTEFTAKTGRAVPANNPPVNAIELDRQFYFLVTLDNGETLMSQQVRVLVVP